MGHQQPAGEGAERRTQGQAGADQAVGAAEPVWRQVLGQELGAAGEGGAFAETQQQAQDEQGDKAGGEAHGGGGEGPERQADSEGAIGVDLLRKPAGQDLTRRVAPEEGRQEQPDLGAREVQLVLEQRGSGGEVAAVHVVDEGHQDQEPDHARADCHGFG